MGIIIMLKLLLLLATLVQAWGGSTYTKYINGVKVTTKKTWTGYRTVFIGSRVLSNSPFVSKRTVIYRFKRTYPFGTVFNKMQRTASGLTKCTRIYKNLMNITRSVTIAWSRSSRCPYGIKHWKSGVFKAI